MKTFLFLCLLPVPLFADAPKKPVPTRYNALHVSSPFTTPAPPIIDNTPVVNPLEDWALTGVSKFPDGYFVVLVNKKKPEETTVIQPGVHSEFEVLEVIDGGMDYTDSTVKLRYGSTEGIVGFDKKLLTVKSPTQNPAPDAQQTGQPTMPPGMPAANGAGLRPQPRVRTIVPPAAQGQVPQGQPQR